MHGCCLLSTDGSICVCMCVPTAGSYADNTISSNRSDDNTEHRNSVGREETLKSFEAKFPLQFKPVKVNDNCRSLTEQMTEQDHTACLGILTCLYSPQTATLRTGLSRVSSMDSQPGHSQSPNHCTNTVTTTGQSELRMTLSPPGR